MLISNLKEFLFSNKSNVNVKSHLSMFEIVHNEDGQTKSKNIGEVTSCEVQLTWWSSAVTVKKSA